MSDVEQSWDDVRRYMAPVNAALFRRFGNRVLSGPFLGMRITDKPVWDDGNVGAKLIGCYEFELHEAVNRAVLRRPRSVVNVGCADGYYAVGLGRRLWDADIFAFDIDSRSVEQCDRVARDNLIIVQSEVGCQSAGQLDIGMGRRRLYVIDCEGKELELLDPGGCPALRTSDIIVECHDFFNPDTSSILEARFSATHIVERIEPRVPDPNQYSFLGEFPLGLRLQVLTEKRPLPTAWLACWANLN